MTYNPDHLVAIEYDPKQLDSVYTLDAPSGFLNMALRDVIIAWCNFREIATVNQATRLLATIANSGDEIERRGAQELWEYCFHVMHGTPGDGSETT